MTLHGGNWKPCRYISCWTDGGAFTLKNAMKFDLTTLLTLVGLLAGFVSPRAISLKQRKSVEERRLTR